MEDYTRTEQYLNGILNGTPVPEPYTREEKLLAAIAQKESGGGGGGGGAEDFVVEFTITPSGNSMSVTANHTAVEVYAAYQQGKNIKGVGEIVGMGMTVLFYLTYIMTESDGSEERRFTGLMFHTFGMEGGSMRIDGDADSWSMSNLG